MPCRSKTYAQKSLTPLINCDAKNKMFVSISGMITSEGDSYFEAREQQGFNQMAIVRFLRKGRKKIRKNISLIWDNASIHKSQAVKDYLVEIHEEKRKLWLFNIPPYSPELNPIEQLWAYLKQQMANQFYPTTKLLKEEIIKQLDEIQKDKELIKSFFRRNELECYQFFT